MADATITYEEWMDGVLVYSELIEVEPLDPPADDPAADRPGLISRAIGYLPFTGK